MCEACVSDATMGVVQGGDGGNVTAETLGLNPAELFLQAGDRDVATLIELAQQTRATSPDLPDHSRAAIVMQRVHWIMDPKTMAAMLTNVAFWLATGNEAGIGQDVEQEADRLADLLDVADERGGPRTGDDLLKAWQDGDVPVGSMAPLAAGSVYTSHPGQYL